MRATDVGGDTRRCGGVAGQPPGSVRTFRGPPDPRFEPVDLEAAGPLHELGRPHGQGQRPIGKKETHRNAHIQGSHLVPPAGRNVDGIAGLQDDLERPDFAAEREALLRSRMLEARRESKRALIERTRLESQEAKEVSTKEPVAPIPVATSAFPRNAGANGLVSESAKTASGIDVYDRLDAMNAELVAIRKAIEELGGGKSVRRRRSRSSDPSA